MSSGTYCKLFWKIGMNFGERWEGRSIEMEVYLKRETATLQIDYNIVTRNGKIVWKHGPRTGRSTHLCWQPSYTRTHSSLLGIEMQTNQRAGQRGLFMDPYLYLFIRLLSAFFFFLPRCKQNKIKLYYNRLQIVKKNKLTLYKTQNRQPNCVDHKFFFNFC